MRMPDKIQPSSVIESGGGNHQCFSLPVTYRITQPGGIHLLGQTAAIGEDGSRDVAVGITFIDNHHHRRRLGDPGHACKVIVRRWVGQAVRARTVCSQI